MTSSQSKIHRALAAFILSFIISGCLSCVVSFDLRGTLDTNILDIWITAWPTGFVLVFLLADKLRRFSAYLLKLQLP